MLGGEKVEDPEINDPEDLDTTNTADTDKKILQEKLIFPSRKYRSSNITRTSYNNYWCYIEIMR